LIDALDVWRTLLAFLLTISGTYMIFIYRGLKRTSNQFTEEIGLFSIASLLAGLTFFLEVLARV